MRESETLKENTQKHFDDWAGHYDDGRMSKWFRYFQSKIIDQVNPQPKQKILDVGCGTGWAVREIARQVPEADAYGIDISGEMIRLAQQQSQGLESAHFQQGDSEHISFPDEHFDAVICSSSFHHYPNPVASLSEIRRVLKNGSALFLLDRIRDKMPAVIIYDLVQKIYRDDHVRYYKSEELIHFLILAGFREIHELLRDQGFFRHSKLTTSEILLQAVK